MPCENTAKGHLAVRKALEHVGKPDLKKGVTMEDTEALSKAAVAQSHAQDVANESPPTMLAEGEQEDFSENDTDGEEEFARYDSDAPVDEDKDIEMDAQQPLFEDDDDDYDASDA